MILRRIEQMFYEWVLPIDVGYVDVVLVIVFLGKRYAHSVNKTYVYRD